MTPRLGWTLATLVTLGGSSLAEPVRGDVDLAYERGSHRGVAEDYLVMPSGGELTGQMKFVMSEPSLGGAPLRFSDLGLFELAGRWSLVSKLEVSGSVLLLPKQPSFTSEKPWQNVALGLRSPIGRHAAVMLSGSGGHLLGHEGMWTREALSVEWRKPIQDVLSFSISGGVDGISLSPPRGRAAGSALITEVAVATSALFREPSGHWGGWVGIGYALPVVARGTDPTTGLRVDPQPRLDLRIGSVLTLTKEWDLFVEYAVVDRGDLTAVATTLPILDGGFDQHQLMLGVTRHLQGPHERPTRDPIQLSLVEKAARGE